MDEIESIENFFIMFNKINDESVTNKFSIIVWKSQSESNSQSRLSQSISSSNSSKNKSSTKKLGVEKEIDSFQSKHALLVQKFKSYCQIYKIIVLYLSKYSEITMDNSNFLNYIGYLLLNKLNDKEAINTKYEKRNSITIGNNDLNSNTNLDDLSTRYRRKHSHK